MMPKLLLIVIISSLCYLGIKECFSSKCININRNTTCYLPDRLPPYLELISDSWSEIIQPLHIFFGESLKKAPFEKAESGNDNTSVDSYGHSKWLCSAYKQIVHLEMLIHKLDPNPEQHLNTFYL